MTSPTETLAQRRARLSLPAVARANQQARAVWWRERQTNLSCASCGARIPTRPVEGQGLPCGH